MRRIIPASLLAVVLGVGLVTTPPASAQAPPTWKQGQPANMADSTLAPIAQPPSPKAPGEIPVAKIKLPPGFKAELWAHGINNARAMTWGDKGTLFVSSRVAGNVYAVVDKGGQREVKVIAKGLTLPNGVAFKDGTLYVAEISRITKMPGIEDKLDNPPAMEVVYEILPRDQPHGWKYLAFGPDGKLYFNIGAPCNICIPPDTHANISRINADGSGFEYFAHGVRNSVGFDWHPVTKAAHQDGPACRRQRGRVLHRLDVPTRVQEPRLPRPAGLLEPDQEDRFPRHDGDAAPRRRAQVRRVRRGLARR